MSDATLPKVYLRRTGLDRLFEDAQIGYRRIQPGLQSVAAGCIYLFVLCIENARFSRKVDAEALWRQLHPIPLAFALSTPRNDLSRVSHDMIHFSFSSLFAIDLAAAFVIQ